MSNDTGYCLYEMSAGFAGLTRYLLGCGRLFSRIGIKDGLAPATAEELKLGSAPSSIVWVEPDPGIVEILRMISTPELARAAAAELRDTEYANPIALWEHIQDNIEASTPAEMLIVLAWSWKGEGKHFAEQRTSGFAQKQLNRHGVVQNERVRLVTLAKRLDAHADAPWPNVTIVQSTAGAALESLPAPCPGDHVNVDRPYVKTTKYPNAHGMPDEELAEVCRWGLQHGASVSVHEGKPMKDELKRWTGAEWREVDLKGKRPGADPRFSKAGEWLMVAGERHE